MVAYATAKRSVWKKWIEAVCQGSRAKELKIGSPRCVISAGVPNTAAPEGTCCYDSTNNDAYINTDGSTTWAKVGG